MHLSDEWFLFSSEACPDAGFHVVRFKGSEGLNQFFEFQITLVSTNPHIDIPKLLSGKVCFTITRENAPSEKFKGILVNASQGAQFHGWTFYDVVLRPSIWLPMQGTYSGVFIGDTLQDTFERFYQFTAFHLYSHEYHFTQPHEPKEFSMMYREVIAEYGSWILEEQGAYFYFANNEDKIIYADSPASHGASRGMVYYSPQTGLDASHREEVITEFSYRYGQTPKDVVLRSYSWKTPNKVIVAQAPVSANGIGTIYLNDEGAETEAEAARIARIRAEQLICESCCCTGKGSVPWMRPGVVFTLASHYQQDFNKDYLITGMTHEGSQETLLSMALHLPLTSVDNHVFYHNTFSCIPASVTYRPARKAKRTQVSGVIRAFIDSNGGDSTRAETDQYGRYKLVFPFDLESVAQGKSSAWVRQAKEQVGKRTGVSFPLLPGTEVLVTFIDGNPDRPVISGALANGETGSLARSNASGIRTAGGNQLVINEKDKKQGIALQAADGSALAITAGSTPVSILNGNTTWNIASGATGMTAGLLGNIASGLFLNQHVSKKFSDSTLLAATLFSGFNTAKKVCDSFNKHFDEPKTPLSVATSTFKTLTASIPLIPLIYSSANQQPISYGFTIDSNEESVHTTHYIDKDPKRTLALLIGANVAKTVKNLRSNISEISDTKDENNTEKELKDIKKEGLEYYKNKKSAAIAKCVVSTLGELIPEIIAGIIIPIIKHKKMKLEKLEDYTLGGISINSTRNINLHSQTYISEHAKESILIIADKNLKEKDALNLGRSATAIDSYKESLKERKNYVDNGDILFKSNYYGIHAQQCLLNINTLYQIQSQNIIFNIYEQEKKEVNAALYFSNDGFLVRTNDFAVQSAAADYPYIKFTNDKYEVKFKKNKMVLLDYKNNCIQLLNNKNNGITITKNTLKMSKNKRDYIGIKNNEITLNARNVKINKLTINDTKIEKEGVLAVDASGIVKIC